MCVCVCAGEYFVVRIGFVYAVFFCFGFDSPPSQFWYITLGFDFIYFLVAFIFGLPRILNVDCSMFSSFFSYYFLSLPLPLPSSLDNCLFCVNDFFSRIILSSFTLTPCVRSRILFTYTPSPCSHSI